MPSERLHGLASPKSLSLERFVALIMSPPGAIQDPNLNKTDIHSTSMSFNSEAYKPCVDTYSTADPKAGTERPDKSGEDLFLRANTLLDEEESITHRSDYNTVGPVPVASGYGSRTLTHSAVHVLDSGKDHVSALSSLHVKIHARYGDSDLWELSETQVGDPKRFSKVSGGPTRGSYTVEGVAKNPLFTNKYYTRVYPFTIGNTREFYLCFYCLMVIYPIRRCMADRKQC